ncbi:MAG: nuclear transport factor 2 family protein [Paucibacter sp.]|nr:nuclear transport factor 2 family protein [Roseateles sp.]
MCRSPLAFALLALLCSSAAAGPKEDAVQVLQQWTRAFTDSDVDGIVKLYAPDAVFLGTGSTTVVVQPQEIRQYFEQALLSNRPRGAVLNSYSAIVLSDSIVAVSGLDTVTGVRDGKPFSANGRVSVVLAKRGTDWQIVQFHRSAMPN